MVLTVGLVCSFQHSSWTLVLKFFQFQHWVRTWILKCSSKTYQVDLYSNLHVLMVSQVIWTWINNNLISTNMKYAYRYEYSHQDLKWKKNHQEMMFVSSLHVGGVVPLESTDNVQLLSLMNTTKHKALFF